MSSPTLLRNALLNTCLTAGFVINFFRASIQAVRFCFVYIFSTLEGVRCQLNFPQCMVKGIFFGWFAILSQTEFAYSCISPVLRPSISNTQVVGLNFVNPSVAFVALTNRMLKSTGMIFSVSTYVRKAISRTSRACSIGNPIPEAKTFP